MELRQQVREKTAKEVNDARARVTQTYGLELEDNQIRDILKAEREIIACKDCTGLPCHKKVNPCWIPSIGVEDGQIVIRYGLCAIRESDNRQKKLNRLMKSARLPPRYIGKTLSDYTEDSDNAAAVNWARTAVTENQGAFLFGERGTGKTFLASIVAQEFIRKGKASIFVKVPALLSEIRMTYNGTSQTNETQLLEEISSVAVLILDDLGMEKPTRFAGTTICNIIDARYDNELPTIITSNYPIEKIRRDFDNATDGESYNGSRLVDRLQEMCKPILFKGKSRRK